MSNEGESSKADEENCICIENGSVIVLYVCYYFYEQLYGR